MNEIWIRTRAVANVVVACLVFSQLGFAAEVEFSRDVRPLLSNSCFSCHGPDRNGQDNDLRLDHRESAIASAIVAGDAGESEVIRRLTSDDPDVMMPPPDSNRARLDESQIALIRRWIDEGANYSGHWAYAVPRRPVPPQVKQGDWGGNAIDAFVAGRNELVGVDQSPPADRRVLARRLSFDLLGLPPTPALVETFASDSSDVAYGNLVDDLLKSEHFGERLAIMWLDLVRFADTVGYHGDQHRDVDAYRDYVIDSFNSNKPFDQFTIEQLAGDLLSQPTREQLIASGFNRLLQTTQEGGAQPAEYRAIYDADRVRNVSTVWLGSTLGCAQCHDHKFDPFSTADFYRFAAFFADVEEVAVGVQKPNLTLPTLEQQAKLRQIDSAITQLKAEQPICEPEDEATREQLKKAYEAKLKKLEDEKNRVQGQVRKTLITTTIAPRKMRVLPRGNWLDASGEEVQPAVPALFGEARFEGDRGTRMDLAQWLVSDNNPLTARVFVNHLWRIMFGYGLVRTPDDFGSQGEFPTHPELLDYLATEFQRSDWNVKYVLRMIAMSKTYQQASTRRYPERDPFNRWYTSQNQFRLDAEMIRDNALSVSGLLLPKIGGRSVKPYQPTGYWKELNFPKRKYQADAGVDQYRRGLYTYWCRTFLHPSLAAFDAPTREECTAQRPRSNTPLQALVLLNDPTYVEAAVALAKRTLTSGGSEQEKLDKMFMRVLARKPTASERDLLLELLAQQLSAFKSNPPAARQLVDVGNSKYAEREPAELVELASWTALARVVLNLHETVTRH